MSSFDYTYLGEAQTRRKDGLLKRGCTVLFVAMGIVLIVLASINTHALMASDDSAEASLGDTRAHEKSDIGPLKKTTTTSTINTEGNSVSQATGQFFGSHTAETGGGDTGTTDGSRRRVLLENEVEIPSIMTRAMIAFQGCAEMSVLGAPTMTDACCRLFARGHIGHWSCDSHTKTVKPITGPDLYDPSIVNFANTTSIGLYVNDRDVQELSWLWTRPQHILQSYVDEAGALIDAFNERRDLVTQDEHMHMNELPTMSSDEQTGPKRYCVTALGDEPHTFSSDFRAGACGASAGFLDWIEKIYARCENCALIDDNSIKESLGHDIRVDIRDTHTEISEKLEPLNTEFRNGGALRHFMYKHITRAADRQRNTVFTHGNSKNERCITNESPDHVVGFGWGFFKNEFREYETPESPITREYYYSGLAGAFVLTTDSSPCMPVYSVRIFGRSRGNSRGSGPELVHSFQPLHMTHWSKKHVDLAEAKVAGSDSISDSFQSAKMTEEFIIRDVLQEEYTDDHVDPSSFMKAECSGGAVVPFEYENIHTAAGYQGMVLSKFPGTDSVIETCPISDTERRANPSWLRYVPCVDGLNEKNRRIFENSTCCCAKTIEANTSPSGNVHTLHAPKRKRDSPKMVNRIITQSRTISETGEAGTVILGPGGVETFTGYVVQAPSSSVTTSPIQLHPGTNEEMTGNGNSHRWLCPTIRDPATWYDGVLLRCTEAGRNVLGCEPKQIYITHNTGREYDNIVDRNVFNFEFRPTQYHMGLGTTTDRIIYARWWNPTYLGDLFKPLGYENEPTVYEKKHCNLQILSTKVMQQTEEVGSIYKISLTRIRSTRKSYKRTEREPVPSLNDILPTEDEPTSFSHDNPTFINDLIAGKSSCYEKAGLDMIPSTGPVNISSSIDKFGNWNKCVFEFDVDVYKRTQGVPSKEAIVGYSSNHVYRNITRRRSLSMSAIKVIEPKPTDDDDDLYIYTNPATFAKIQHRRLAKPNCLS